MATSSIPAAIDGCITLLSASSALAGVHITDGQPTTDVPLDFVAIGYADEGGDSITGRQDPQTLGNMRRSEIYSISCEISSWTGAATMKPVRDRAFYLMAAVETAIRADGTLAGSVAFADFGGSIAVAQVQTVQGAVVTIKFTIEVKINRI